MIRHSRTEIDWCGAWIGGNGWDQRTLQELQQLVPCHDLQSESLPDLDLALVWGFQSPQKWIHQVSGKVIAVSHGASQWNREQLTYLVPHAIAGVAVSQAAFDASPAAMQRMMAIIPNGIEFDRIAPIRPRAELRLELQVGYRNVVGYVGRMSEEKSPLAVAAAVGELRRRDGDAWVALMCGPTPSPELAARYRAEAEQLNPGGNIWLPETERLGDVYAALDYFVLASPAEGYALVVAEAWAAGVPVISTRVGMIPEMEAKHGPLTWSIDTPWNGAQIANVIKGASGFDRRVAKAQLVVWENCSAAAMGYRWGKFLQTIANQVRN